MTAQVQSLAGFATDGAPNNADIPGAQATFWAVENDVVIAKASVAGSMNAGGYIELVLYVNGVVVIGGRSKTAGKNANALVYMYTVGAGNAGKQILKLRARVYQVTINPQATPNDQHGVLIVKHMR